MDCKAGTCIQRRKLCGDSSMGFDWTPSSMFCIYAVACIIYYAYMHLHNFQGVAYMQSIEDGVQSYML